jgi:RNA polymerase sigma factor for flagellar operon FliA
MENPSTETELLDKFLATRDAALREEIIVRFVPLVRFVLGRLGVSKYHSDQYDDLESQGVLGLIEAVDNYKRDYGTRLSTYATFKIRSKILDYLRGIDWLPRTARQRVRAVQEGMAVLEGQLHRLPTDEELAKHLNMDTETLQQALLDSSRTIVSLDDDRSEDTEEGNVSIYEKVVDPNQNDPSEEYESTDMQNSLSAALKSLPEREQMVLSLYYFEELTFKEIGKVMDISESRVCQIHGRAVLNLKATVNGTMKTKQ